jgi:glycosyltransferase involved in cell wall biosynthesis
MRILYHHRTQAEDAQGVHIHEIIRCFRGLGHEVREVALVTAADGPRTSALGKRGGSGWRFLRGAVPQALYELLAMAYNIVGSRRLTRAVREFRPDFIYERYSLFTTCGIRVAMRHGIPLILEVNAPLALEQENLGKLTFRRLARKRELWIASNSTCTIVVSTPMKRLFVELGVSEDHLEVLPNGVDPERFHGRDASSAIRSRYGLEGKSVLGFVGWIREWHGLTELVASLGETTDVHLLIVGDGPARASVERAASSAGVSDRVHVTGPVDREAMPDHISAFDLALQPAATRYASPMKVFEYLAMGKPVLACRQENLEEILTEGRDALFFPPGEFRELARLARELLADRPRLKRMSAAARDTIGRRGFLWHRNAERAVEMASGAMQPK